MFNVYVLPWLLLCTTLNVIWLKKNCANFATGDIFDDHLWVCILCNFFRTNAISNRLIHIRRFQEYFNNIHIFISQVVSVFIFFSRFKGTRGDKNQLFRTHIISSIGEHCFLFILISRTGTVG